MSYHYLETAFDILYYRVLKHSLVKYVQMHFNSLWREMADMTMNNTPCVDLLCSLKHDTITST